MGRLLFLIAIVLLVYVLVKSFRANSLKRDAESQPALAEDMVRCVHCGVHLPKSESVQSAGQSYCCQAHLDAHHV